jgi:CheY-like chemotaxis protein
MIENLQLRDVRVLIDIENASTRGIAADLLRAKGCLVVEASSEAATFAALETANRTQAPFNLMVVDCETQAGDGFAALRRIRAAEPNAPAIVLANSHGLAAKLRQMRQQGVKDYCIKPIKRGDLYRAIAELITNGAPAHPSPQAPRGVVGPEASPQKITERPLRILLADDSPDNRMLIRAYTKKTPYVLTEAENGQLAVERFLDSNYDLVLMDIQMPVLDGYSAIRAIRKRELETGARRTPIIALTASALEEDVRRAKQAGCDMHVSKPIKKSTLLDSIDRAIRTVNESSALGSISVASASSADFHI